MQDKVVLVTGGSSGIGLAAAQRFAQAGARVAIASRDAERGRAALAQLEQHGEAIFIQADVTRATDVERLVDQITKTFGRLDCAVNNAGDTGIMRRLVDQPEDEFDDHMLVNLKSVWLCMKYELRQMVQQTSGAIVNVSSVKGQTGVASYSHYAASKHAVNGLTKSAALEYAKEGIRVNAVAPAAIHTPTLEKALHPVFQNPTPDEDVAQYGAMLPMGRAGQPPEVAEAIVWLCSDAASFITGHILAVDGGSLVKGVP